MTQPRWLDERENRAWRALNALRTPLEAALNRQLSKDSGLSTADYAVLVELSEAPGHVKRFREVVLGLGWEKSRLSHQVKRMQARGLIAKDSCETDGRGAYLRISDAGMEAIEQAAPGHVQLVRELIIDRLSPTQLEQLADIGEQISAALRSEPCQAALGVAENEDCP